MHICSRVYSELGENTRNGCIGGTIPWGGGGDPYPKLDQVQLHFANLY